MPRPRRYDDSLRLRLLDVAAERIAHGGPAHLSLREAARAAGTSTSAVYGLFGSRDDLVAAVREEAFRRFGARLGTVDRSADPGADLLALGLAYREFALAEPNFYRVMFDDAPQADAVQEPTFAVLRDAAARLAPSLGATEAAVVLWALVHGLVGLELAGLVPGTDAERASRYRRALVACGPVIVGTEA